jgi:spore coat polysaccharide biosynthesis protein SpsF (cytidylyltransferase family)
LPGKVLLPLNGHTVVEEVIARCQQIPGIARVVLAIPDNPHNDELAAVGRRHVAVFRGMEHDVLGRYWDCTRIYNADAVMRITADCPLLCPSLCGDVLLALMTENADFASNIDPRTFPQGFDCEVFTIGLLRRADLEATGRYAREHVTPWMLNNDQIKRVNVSSKYKLEGRCVLDTRADYHSICAALDCTPGQRVREARPAPVAV